MDRSCTYFNCLAGTCPVVAAAAAIAFGGDLHKTVKSLSPDSSSEKAITVWYSKKSRQELVCVFSLTIYIKTSNTLCSVVLADRGEVLSRGAVGRAISIHHFSYIGRTSLRGRSLHHFSYIGRTSLLGRSPLHGSPGRGGGGDGPFHPPRETATKIS